MSGVLQDHTLIAVGNDTPAAKSPSPKPSGIDAFPSLDEPQGSSEVRVTGTAGLGEDKEREEFESAFPDLGDEVAAPVSAMPAFSWPAIRVLILIPDGTQTHLQCPLRPAIWLLSLPPSRGPTALCLEHPPTTTIRFCV